MFKRAWSLGVVVALGAVLAAPASAAIITFDSLTGSNGDNFTMTTEATFTVTDITGGWVEAHNFGNPVPSIFNAQDLGTAEVSEGTTGLFTFNSVDLGNANSGSSTSISYVVEGFLNNVSVLLTAATIGSQASFTTIFSPDNTVVLDTLRISIDGTNTSSYNIDNINVDIADIPEPGTLILLGMGLAGIGVTRRRTRFV